MNKRRREPLEEGDIHLIQTLGDRVFHQDLAGCLGIDVETVGQIFKAAITTPVYTRKGIRLHRLKPKL